MAGESSPNLYEVLQVAPDAQPDDLRASYRRLAREHHPDLAGADSQAMALINQAYETLSDPERRARYDRGLAARPEPRKPGRVVLPADRARRRRVWAACGVAAAVLTAAAVVLGLRAGQEPVAPVQTARPAPVRSAAEAPRSAAGEEGLRLIPSRSIGTPPSR